MTPAPVGAGVFSFAQFAELPAGALITISKFLEVGFLTPRVKSLSLTAIPLLPIVGIVTGIPAPQVF
jgi:hypothetical protein